MGAFPKSTPPKHGGQNAEAIPHLADIGGIVSGAVLRRDIDFRFCEGFSDTGQRQWCRTPGPVSEKQQGRKSR